MRHSRHARKLSRGQMLARNMRKRAAQPAEPVQAEPTYAPEPEPEPQAVAAPEAAQAAPVLPYDPVSVPVRQLTLRLGQLDDAEVIRALQAADPRTSAGRYYEARLEELVGA